MTGAVWAPQTGALPRYPGDSQLEVSVNIHYLHMCGQTVSTLCKIDTLFLIYSRWTSGFIWDQFSKERKFSLLSIQHVEREAKNIILNTGLIRLDWFGLFLYLSGNLWTFLLHSWQQVLLKSTACSPSWAEGGPTSWTFLSSLLDSVRSDDFQLCLIKYLPATLLFHRHPPFTLPAVM